MNILLDRKHDAEYFWRELILKCDNHIEFVKVLLEQCNIQAKNSNLEEFYLSKFDDQGMTSFKDNYPTQSMFYYLIVPSHIDSINFSYYNPKTLQFVNVELPVILEENLVSTQTDLNPNSGNMLRYKQIIVLVLLLSCIIIYIMTRNIAIIYKFPFN